jgi:hypothetical protein
MKVTTLIEIISAAHVTKFIESPWHSRGGIFLVGPPGSLKTTIIKNALAEYPDTILMSDVNVNSLTVLRNSLIGGRYNTLGFGEFEKIYQRNPASASNVEGHLRAMVEEGFDRTSFEDPRMSGMSARCLLIGGITPTCYAQKYLHWENSGFARRFLWCHYRLANPDEITNAIHRWTPIVFGKISHALPANRIIPFKISSEHSRWLSHVLDTQPDKGTPYILLKKIFRVLEWRYSKKKAIEIIRDFAPSLSKSGTEVTL